MSQCRVCSGETFGYGGSLKMPLCRHHYIKTIQLACYYYDRESCPYEGSDEEWAAVQEIIEAGDVK